VSRTGHYTAQFVDSFPAPFEPGIIYVSAKYSTAGHLCPCGCEREVVTKLSPARWRLIFDGEVSLRPSIAAAGIPCNSHYFITRGVIEWQLPLSAAGVARARENDRRALDAQHTAAHPGWPARLWRYLRQRSR
jgi:uncharacterized protein DUF6527